MKLDHFIEKNQTLMMILVNIGKFVGVVVVPCVMWLTIIRQEVTANAHQIEEQKQQIQKLKDDWSDELARIARDIGEIKGELKRIGQ
jgi:cell division protein FtsB